MDVSQPASPATGAAASCVHAERVEAPPRQRSDAVPRRAPLVFTSRAAAESFRAQDIVGAQTTQHHASADDSRRRAGHAMPEPASPPQMPSGRTQHGNKRKLEGGAVLQLELLRFRPSPIDTSVFHGQQAVERPLANLVAPVDRILIVKEPWITFILQNKKTWELRGSVTNMRGRIGLVASGSGCIVGGATLIGCRGPLSAEDLRENSERHCVPLDQAGAVYRNTHAWVLKDAVRLATPVRYRHPPGAIIWVKLEHPVVC